VDFKDFGGPQDKNWPFANTEYKMPEGHDERTVLYPAEGTKDTVHGQVGLLNKKSWNRGN